MISISYRAFLALPLLLVLTGSALSEPATMTWPDAVAQLTAERTRAETCVAVLKRYGNKEQVGRGELSYTNAKADADAVIAGLVTALSAGQEPAAFLVWQSSATRWARWCPARPGKRAAWRAY